MKWANFTARKSLLSKARPEPISGRRSVSKKNLLSAPKVPLCPSLMADIEKQGSKTA